METVDPFKRSYLHDSFRNAVYGIVNDISSSQSAIDDGHWAKSALLCRDVDLEPILIKYRDKVLVLNAFGQ